MIEFGKYKGCEIEDVLEEDPQYLIWCYENDVQELVDDELYERAVRESIRNKCDGEVSVEY